MHLNKGTLYRILTWSTAGFVGWHFSAFLYYSGAWSPPENPFRVDVLLGSVSLALVLKLGLFLAPFALAWKLVFRSIVVPLMVPFILILGSLIVEHLAEVRGSGTSKIGVRMNSPDYFDELSFLIVVYFSSFIYCLNFVLLMLPLRIRESLAIRSSEF